MTSDRPCKRLILTLGLLLVASGGAWEVASSAQEPGRGLSPGTITNSRGMKFTLIKAGEFLKGSPDTDKDAFDDEKPQHRVRITRPFYMGIHEVTQAQYEAVMGNNPSWFAATGQAKDKLAGQSTRQHPVEGVSWLDAVKFCNKLSELEGLTPFNAIDGENVRVSDWRVKGYRLPTEAEWEYACRAKTTGRYSFGEEGADLGQYACFAGNSGDMTHPVGTRQPNAFGLFDMHGNVWEWCWDSYDKDYYKQSRGDDPTGPDIAGAAVRVIRGGSWDYDPRFCRSTYRRALARLPLQLPGLPSGPSSVIDKSSFEARLRQWRSRAWSGRRGARKCGGRGSRKC